jgi:Activator of Hsp90 ATPase homolog 1-like protein.
MKKEKYCLEYVFEKASKSNLWTRIATSTGLSEWFADEVNDEEDGKLYTFTWNKYPSQAEVIGFNQNNYIRFRWLEEENENNFFEFRLHTNELTGGLVLEVTDFAEPHEKEDSMALWDTQITTLRRLLGLL